MRVSSSVNISGALWWIAFTTVHSVFFIRKLYYRPRLNIPIFLAILGWKYSCNILNYRLWHVILFGLDTCLVSRSVSRYIVQGQDVTSDDAWRWGKRVQNNGTETKNVWSLSSPNKMTKFYSICFLLLDAKSVVHVVSDIKLVHKISRKRF